MINIFKLFDLVVINLFSSRDTHFFFFLIKEDKYVNIFIIK